MLTNSSRLLVYVQLILLLTNIKATPYKQVVFGHIMAFPMPVSDIY